jgi:hypothetical protein
MPGPASEEPKLNSYAELWVWSVKEECLSKLILFGENSLRRAVSNFLEHFHNAIIRAGTLLPFPPARLHLQIRSPQFGVTSGSVACSSSTAAPHEILLPYGFLLQFCSISGAGEQTLGNRAFWCRTPETP